MKTTIAAISTAMNASGIGIVRISGPDSMKVIKKIYRSKSNKKDISLAVSHTIHYGFIYDEDQCIDEVLVMIMKSPRTFTGEDTVEIDCHGGVYAMKRVLETVLKNGAILAEPGEFTKRAFLNGRLDLSEAEAVMDIISARNKAALNNSMKQLKGSVKREIVSLREDLIYQIAYIESALDDPEHYDLTGYPDKLDIIMEKIILRMDHLIKNSENGRMLQDGIKTVILGKPNAGKSSLLNTILGENRAIVTEIAGTTRDVLEEYISLGGISLKITDTAGIHSTDDIVEKIGVEKAIDNARSADLILYVVDSSIPLDKNDEDIISIISDKKSIVIYNKTDLEARVSVEEIKEKTSSPVVGISSLYETGIDDLEECIKALFFSGEISLDEDLFITSSRHKEAMTEARDSLLMVRQSISDQMPEDFYSIDLMSAYSALGRITGEEVEDDLVNEIFSKFCMGK